MKIQTAQEINVPNGFYCNAGGRCYKKHTFEEQGHTYHVCGVFSEYLQLESWSGKVIKCSKCIDETLRYINSHK